MKPIKRVSTSVPGLFRLQHGDDPIYGPDGAYVCLRPDQGPLRWILFGGEIQWSNGKKQEILSAMIEGAGI